MKEADRSDTAFFVTFTYDQEHVPMTKNGFMTLNKKHVQLFFKKLRHKHHGKQIKYYAAGEYGGKGKRPHYHIILFNADLEKLIGRKAANHYRLGYIDLDGKVEYLCPSWEHGHITIGSITEASVGYTLKYICKPSKVPLHSRDDRQKDFALMSKRMGDNYISLRTQRWHQLDQNNRFHLTLVDGKKIGMPRYYKEKIYSDSQRKHIGTQARLKSLEKQTWVDTETGEVIESHNVDKVLKEMTKNNLICLEKGRKSQKDLRKTIL